MTGNVLRCFAAALLAVALFACGDSPAQRAPGTLPEVPGLPDSLAADVTADYTRRVLAGELPVPPAIAAQVAHICALTCALTQEPSPHA